MEQHLLLILAFTQIPIVFVLATRTYCGLICYRLVQKNRQWIREHLEFTGYKTFTRTITYISYLIALLSLLATIELALNGGSPIEYINVLVIPLVLWTIAGVFYQLVFQYRILPLIPPPNVRKASMIDRKLSAYVPLWIVYLGFALIFSIVVIYSFSLLGIAISAETAVRRIFGLSVGVIITFFVLRDRLRRKDSEMEEIVGSHGRRLEIIGAVAILYGFVFVGVFRVFGDFFKIYLFSDARFFIVIVFSIQVWFVVMRIHPKVKKMLRDYYLQDQQLQD
jgi:hypothetical protein